MKLKLMANTPWISAAEKQQISTSPTLASLDSDEGLSPNKCDLFKHANTVIPQWFL